MDDTTNERLRETAENCIKAYNDWAKSKKDLSAREGLMEALHELRKVASRVEIEVAVSEREDVTARPLPIPPHRAAQARPISAQNGDEEGSAQPRRRLNPRGPRTSSNPGEEG